MIFDRLRWPYRNQAWRILAELRAEIGDARFAALWQETIGGQLPDMPVGGGQNDLLQRLIAFIQAQTWAESEQLVTSQSDLLSVEADDLLAQLAAAQNNEGARQTIEKHRKLLARCREIGVASAFAELRAQLRQEPETETASSDDAMRRLLSDVYALLTQGGMEQRQGFASELTTLRTQLPSEGAALSMFLSCLAGTLRNKAVDTSQLESPFSGMWQALQEALEEARHPILKDEGVLVPKNLTRNQDGG